MKLFFKLLLAVLLTTTAVNCVHVHDKECGYDEDHQIECSHEHDDSCFGVLPRYGYDPDDNQG